MSCANVPHDGALNCGFKTNKNLMNASFSTNQNGSSTITNIFTSSFRHNSWSNLKQLGEEPTPPPICPSIIL